MRNFDPIVIKFGIKTYLVLNPKSNISEGVLRTEIRNHYLCFMTTGTPLPCNIKNQDLLLLPQKAIYWKQEKALIAADVHLGKVGHFRKAGIAIPRDLEQNELSVLSDLIFEHKPDKLILLGDFFHSDMNADWDWFILWRSQFPKLKIILIKGNHDIIDETYYRRLNIMIHSELLIGPFLMLPSSPWRNPFTQCGRLCLLRAYSSRHQSFR